jgi:hypothetical protein
MGAHGPATDEKREALEDVLASATFLRAEQLRNFLRYVCEMEIAGRAGELSEYVIGVEALGRPPGYSTAEDSSVRRRAHALRQKLDELYATELTGARIRIDLPKGSYAPRFLYSASHPPGRLDEAPGAGALRDVAAGNGGPHAEDGAEAVVPAAGPAPAGSAWPKVALAAGAVVAGAVLASAAWWVSNRPGAAVDPVLAAAWAPLVHSGSNLVVCVSAPAHYGLLPYPTDGVLPPMVSPHPVDPALLEWYHNRYPLAPDQRLGAHLTSGPVRLGEVFGLIAAVRTLERMGAEFQIVAERSISLPALRDRNLLLLANPDYSFAAKALLDRAFWTIGYDPATRERVVRPSRAAAAAGKVFVPARRADEILKEVFGLLTVLPSEGSGSSTTVLVSCTNAAGCQAALEFFSSAQSMRDLLGRFGQGEFPDAYQVVIRCRVHISQAITGTYEDHVILQER